MSLKLPKKRGVIQIIAGLFALGLLFDTFNKIPNGGVILIAGFCVVWACIISGRLWPSAPIWMTKVSSKAFEKAKITFIASAMVLLAGVGVYDRQAAEHQRPELPIQELRDQEVERQRIARQRVAELEATSSELRHYIPSNLNLKNERKVIERELASAKKKLAVVKNQEAFVAAYAATCGEKPLRSSWDGKIVEVKMALTYSAHDPDSIEVTDCTDPTMSEENCWVTTCRVRGKNIFGALVLNENTFSISKLGVKEL